jgi:hypothetical protein
MWSFLFLCISAYEARRSDEQSACPDSKQLWTFVLIIDEVKQGCRFLSCRHLLWYCSCLEGVMDTSRLMLQWTLFPTPVSQNQQRKNIDDDQQRSQSIITSDIIPRTCTEQWRASERRKHWWRTPIYIRCTIMVGSRGTKSSYFSRRSKVDIPMVHLTIVDL